MSGNDGFPNHMRRVGGWRSAARVLLSAGGRLLVFLVGASAMAGMPAPLPNDFEYETVTRLTDWTRHRIQAISFFVVGVLLCALIVKWLWNAVRRDWPSLPRLRYRSALAGTLLWGLMFVIVLTMISGARELMTPGAWEQEGFTYRLAEEMDEEASRHPDINMRKVRLEKLSIALLKYALAHEGRFPDSLDDAVETELRTVPQYSNVEYFYNPGLTTVDESRVLLYEPEIDAGERWTLMTDGKVRPLSTKELNQLLPVGEAK